MTPGHFPVEPNGATFSPDRIHRYTLTRQVNSVSTPRSLTCIGLNPSTADETHNDPTITREIGLARRLGFDRLLKVNLFSWRATKPRDMLDAHRRGEQVDGGPMNLAAIRACIRASEMVIAVWGGPYSPRELHFMVLERGLQVARYAEEEGNQLHALAVTKDGHPRHTLYLRNDLLPRPWSPADVTP